jgi:hypothetical protein
VSLLAVRPEGRWRLVPAEGSMLHVGTKWTAALVEADATAMEQVAKAALAFADRSLADRSKLSLTAAPAEAPGSRLWSLGWSLGPRSKRVDSYDKRPDLRPAFGRLTVDRRSVPIFERLREELLVDFPDFALAVLASGALGRAWFVGRLEVVGYQAFVELRDGHVHEGTIVYRGDGPYVVRFERGRARVRQPGEDEEFDPDDHGLASISGGAFSGVDAAIDAFYQHAYYVEWALRRPRARGGPQRIEHGSRDALAPPEPAQPRRKARPERARPKLAPFPSLQKGWARFFREDDSIFEIAKHEVDGMSELELEHGLFVLFSGEDDKLARRFLTRCLTAAKQDQTRPAKRGNGLQFRAQGLRSHALASLLLARATSLEPFRAVASAHYDKANQYPGAWSEFDEEEYLVAVRAALILGDLELYAAMPPRRKRLARHAKEQELLTRLANDPGDPHLARSFRSFLDAARRPSRLADARVVELAALYDRYFVSRDSSIDWSRVVTHVVGGRHKSGVARAGSARPPKKKARSTRPPRTRGATTRR